MAFFPVHDQNPLKIVPFQFVTIVLMAACAGLFAWQTTLPEDGQLRTLLAYGIIPAVLFDQAVLPPALAAVPAELTVLTYMFFHGDIWHLIGNLLFLWVFGDNVEDAMGHLRFLLFYLACGIAGGVCHGLLLTDSVVPMIGASGAVSGVLGAYLVLHPRVKVLALVFKHIPLYLPAYWLIGAWLLMQIVSVAIGGERETVAWWAHIGGFIAGALLVVPLRDKSIPLFDRGTAH